MNCINKEKNITTCNCSYNGCSRHGICCECVRYHRERNELPACYFDNNNEKTWDRSIDSFIKIWEIRKFHK